MSFCLSGVYAPITDTKLVIEVKTTHPLIRLANALDWLYLVRLVEKDLKQSTGKRMRGLNASIKIGQFPLQCLIAKRNKKAREPARIMSICYSGLKCKLKKTVIAITVEETHPLMRLANALDWQGLTAIVLPDLKRTAKGFWWLGRKLQLRIHLSVYLLQQLLNATDRGMEQALRDNAVYQVFCGKTIVKRWHCPDHTKIESFRSRLSPETQCALANAIAKHAVNYGFADAAHLDIDSTVQEADIQYPAAPNLLVKVAVVARRIQKLLGGKLPEVVCGKLPAINLKAIKGLARSHYLIQRRKSEKHREAKQKTLKQLWQAVCEKAQPVLPFAAYLAEPFMLESLTKREQQLVTQFLNKAPVFLSELFEHCYEQAPLQTRIFSFHRDAIACFNKGKAHKRCEFGRQFQIGRIAGNFVYSIPNDSLRMPDAASLKTMLTAHIHTFQTPIDSFAADKGYYSKDNERLLLAFKVQDVGLQKPLRKLDKPPDNPLSDSRREALANRRAGIEPIIGHLKRHWQMGRSRMKSDSTTEASGYCALLGFNLRQMMNCLVNPIPAAVA